MLRMEHISKRFGSFYANKDITLTVNRGEVLTLLGENGAGKSTLMNILIGLYQPTEGKIFLEGKEVRIESPSQAVKLGIGMVHQHFMLVEAMTVFDNIILGDKHAKGLFIDRARAGRRSRSCPPSTAWTCSWTSSSRRSPWASSSAPRSSRRCITGRSCWFWTSRPPR